MTAVPDLFKALAATLTPRTAKVGLIERLNAKLLRIVLEWPSLTAIPSVQPGQEFSFRFGDSFITSSRHYSVRRFDRARGTLELLVFLHGHGPGSRWAEWLRPGDTVHLWGPGGNLVARPEPSFHLFVGDETALGAFSGIVETLPKTADVLGVITIDAGNDAIVRAAGLTFVAVPRHTDGDPDRRMLSLLERWNLPSHDAAAYVAGRAQTVSAVRQLLVRTHGWSKDRIAIRAFWSEGKAGL